MKLSSRPDGTQDITIDTSVTFNASAKIADVVKAWLGKSTSQTAEPEAEPGSDTKPAEEQA